VHSRRAVARLYALLKEDEMSPAKVRAVRFWLQETKSFPEGAPQRETYMDDLEFDRACLVYDREWRKEYRCTGCATVSDCPQCSEQKETK
jgi:hypothetical protein